jgi:hypothetical protein
MKIVKSVAKHCSGALDCPEIYELEDGTVLARGYKPDADTRSQLNLPDNEDIVVLPAAILQALRG